MNNWKKRYVCIILTLLGIVFLSGCVKNSEEDNSTEKGFSGEETVQGTDVNEDVEYPENALEIVGKFIPCQGVSPDTAKMTIDNQGMSGLNSSIHLHSSDQEETNAYVTNTLPVLIYDLGSVQRLGYLYVWNLNTNGLLDSGLKEVVIEYSVDGDHYVALGQKPIVLGRALEEENELYGGNAANNLADQNRTPINFRGINARYVRITALSNYGGEKYGLSEVRFFAYKTRVEKGDEIIAFSTAPNAPAQSENVSNGVNIRVEDGFRWKETEWSAPINEDIKDNFIYIDLDGSYPVDRIRVYNYSVFGQFEYGVKEFSVFYCTESPYKAVDSAQGNQPSYETDSWKQMGGVYKMEASDESGREYIDIDFNGMQVQYIKIIPESNHGGDHVGISAVQVFADAGIATVPEYEWTGLLSSSGMFPYQQSVEFGSPYTGWLSADGIYTVNLNGSDSTGSANKDTKTMFIFSDTFYGNYRNYSYGEYGHYGETMNIKGGVNHSIAYLTGDKPDPRNLSFWLHSGESKGNIIDARDWLTDLVCIDKTIYLYGMRFNDIWMPDSMDFVKIKLDEQYVPELKEHPEMRENAEIIYVTDKYFYNFGGGMLDHTIESTASPDPDGYIYIYGYRRAGGGIKRPIVARSSKENFEHEDRWEFYDGENWVVGIENTGLVGDIDISSEFSVHYAETGIYAGKWLLCYTDFCESGKIMMTVADSPAGPFLMENTKMLYYCNESTKLMLSTGDSGVYAYNAKCHPHLSKEGEMLISYNLNTHNFNKTKAAMEYLYPHFVVAYEIQ